MMTQSVSKKNSPNSDFLTRRTTQLGTRWHFLLYPKGVASNSPGLRRASRRYPGYRPMSSYPNGVSSRCCSHDARNETKPRWGLNSYWFPPRARRCAKPGLEDETPLGLSIKSIKEGAIAIPILYRCGSGSLTTASYHDTAKTPEIFLHGLILGILLPLREFYRFDSNIEAGKGRADLICRPKKPGFTAKLIEFKASNNEAEMETLATAALTQIDKKKYAARHRAEGHADFTKLSVVICGKECRVRKA